MNAVFPRCLPANRGGHGWPQHTPHEGSDMYIGIGTLILVILLILLLT